jgi:hypothetical protein
MPSKIFWTLNVQVSGGPKLSGSNTIEVDAYDMVEIAIPQGETKEVMIQPDELANIEFLLIKSDQYGDAGHRITYKVDGLEVVLDSLQVFIGNGAINLLQSKPDKITFINHLDNIDATVQILVGRKAP